MESQTEDTAGNDVAANADYGADSGPPEDNVASQAAETVTAKEKHDTANPAASPEPKAESLAPGSARTSVSGTSAKLDASNEADEPSTKISQPPSDAGSTRAESTKSSPQKSASEGRIEENAVKCSKASERSADSKRSKKNKGKVEANAHHVTFTVTIAKAIPTAEDDNSSESRATKQRKRIVEAPRAQNYFHCEYNLLPDDEENVKTDVVTFGVAAKIYTERQEAKVLKTWSDGDLTWVAWTHAHSVTITEDLLKKLFKHNVEFRGWDTRDKLSTRARYDRPKAFKLPQAKPGEDADGAGGVKGLILQQCSSYQANQPKKSYIDRPLPSQTRPSTTEPEDGHTPRDDTQRNQQHKSLVGNRAVPRRTQPKPSSPTPTTLVQIPAPKTDRKEDLRSFSRLGKLAGVSSPVEPPPERKTAPRSRTQGGTASKQTAASRASTIVKATRQPSPSDTDRNQNRLKPLRQSSLHASSDLSAAVSAMVDMGGSVNNIPDVFFNTLDHQHAGAKGSISGLTEHNEGSSARPKKNKELKAAALAQAEYIKKNGIFRIPVQMGKLFAGMDTITERLSKPINGVEDMFVTVSINGPLMSLDQLRTLNPLVMKVHSATEMPATPILYEELRLRCQPAYVKYQMFDGEEQISIGREQDRSIYWDDINVVLAGTMESSQLREYLSGPPLEIEVHDRDRIVEVPKLQPALFGDDLEDEKISNVGTVASKRTVHSPFGGKDKPWDPYGVAKVDLSELLLGQQLLHVTVPIHQCVIPDVLGIREIPKDGKLIGVAGAVDGPVDTPLPTGHYLQSGSSLKVKVEVAYPLVTPTQIATKEELESTVQCPFARIVYKFDYKNVAFLHELRTFVTDVNATALELTEMPPELVKAALSTYKLSPEQQNSAGLDLLTGFQLVDGTVHLFILEGLRSGAIRRLWETIAKEENSDVEVLYHSDLAFSSRLYGSLDADLCTIKLHEPLSLITQQPLLYVRDMVPKPCFQALVKLHELALTPKLRDAIRNDVFPSAKMVTSMSKEFGVPMTAADHEALQPRPPEEDKFPLSMPVKNGHSVRKRTVLDNTNSHYIDRLQERATTAPNIDFTEANKSMVREKSMLNSMEHSRTMPMKIRQDNGAVYNYSSQTCNSTEQTKEVLRQYLAQNPDVRYTYCPEYHHSMTVVPVNTESQRRQVEKASKDAWKTPDGWVLPGKKTMVESNVHPRKLHPARAEDLEQPWEELSRLPRGQPVSRSRYSWKRRQEDFDIWTRPHPVFGNDEPITIQLAGEKLKRERQVASENDFDTWKSKVIVEDPQSYFHRCATETELKAAGLKSSNQVDRLQGMLKDPGSKYALRKPGLALKDIPPLNVVLNPSVDSRARELGLNTRPAVLDEFDPKVKGFMPGPYEEKSWTVDQNQIPIRDYQHGTFVKEVGQDFNVYHKERSHLYKPHIHPLTDDEYKLSLFRWPTDYCYLPNINSFQRARTFGSINTAFVPHHTSSTLQQKESIESTS